MIDTGVDHARASRDALPSFGRSRARGGRGRDRVRRRLRRRAGELDTTSSTTTPSTRPRSRSRPNCARRWCTRSTYPRTRRSPTRCVTRLGPTSPNGRRSCPRARRAPGAASSRSTRSCRRSSRHGSIRWSSTPAGRRGLRRQAQSGEGSRRGDRDRAGRRRPDRCVRRRLRRRSTPARTIDPRRSEPGVTVHPGVARTALWEAMARAAVVLCPAQVGGAVRDGRGRGTGVRDARRGVPPRRAR